MLIVINVVLRRKLFYIYCEIVLRLCGYGINSNLTLRMILIKVIFIYGSYACNRPKRLYFVSPFDKYYTVYPLKTLFLIN